MDSGDPSRLRGIAERLAEKVTPTREARQVRLLVTSFGVWTTAKNALVVGIIIGVLMITAVFIAWTSFQSAGGLNAAAAALVGTSSPTLSSSLTAFLTTKTVMAAAIVLAVLQIVATTVTAVVGALAYNASVRLTGGILLGFEGHAGRP